VFRAIVAIAAAFGLALGATAQEKEKSKDKQPTAQQERMKSCNAQASKKGMKGDERKAFMSKCLKA